MLAMVRAVGGKAGRPAGRADRPDSDIQHDAPGFRVGPHAHTHTPWAKNLPRLSASAGQRALSLGRLLFRRDTASDTVFYEAEHFEIEGK
jgi:hypothetical protein